MAGTWSLRFGSLDFSPGSEVDAGVEVQVHGLLRGRPVPVVRTIDSLIQDGGLETVDRRDNRDQQVIVAFRSSDSLALAQAEATLFLECQQSRNELAWTPPDGFGPTTVFDVLWADLEFTEADDWDLKELRGWRAYVLTLRCLPFGRSESETVDNALVVGATPTTVTMFDGTSATGWTSPAGTVTSTSGYLLVPNGASAGVDQRGDVWVANYPVEASVALSPVVDFTATPYLSLELERAHSWESLPFSPRVWVDGVELTKVAQAWTTPTTLRSTYLCNDASATTLRVQQLVETTYPVGTAAPDAAIRVDNVSRSNQPPNASTTGRESLRTITVGGSARTQGSIGVSHATAGLGDVLVYTCPALSAGYSPELRRWRTSGGTVVVDATTVSGSREDTTTNWIFNMPAAPMPRGSYVLLARVRALASNGNRAISWTAATKIGATTFGSQSGTSPSYSLTTTDWQIVPIGGMTLPTTDVADGSSASVQITAQPSLATEYDEMWLFYLGEDTALTQVAAGSGTPALGTVHNRLWIDTASLDRPSPAVWLGTLADRTDAFHAGEKAPAWGVHSLPPGDVKVYVVTTGAANPAVPVRRFKRWMTHAAEAS